ncbi:(d)CMP kinase [Rapidithrix thailandica]|uniref:Cytidylate kinase n=1 Tax=Rapidithrix thailandica TaxID=413964 RepID=A0AAW9SGH1_9BACT
MKKLIVAIDGHSGCGKSTTAKLLAEQLNYMYIDSGAMYRAVTLYFLRQGIAPDDVFQVKQSLEQIDITFEVNPESGKSEIVLNGEKIEAQIRTMEVSGKVSEVSAIPVVRRFLVEQQQKLGENKGIVMDGRDIGTVVFPEAEVKVFMTADIMQRAMRRQKELVKKGQKVDLSSIIDNLSSRDFQDSNRDDSPLRKADDAVVLDTSNITIAQQTERILEVVQQKLTKEA